MGVGRSTPEVVVQRGLADLVEGGVVLNQRRDRPVALVRLDPRHIHVPPLVAKNVPRDMPAHGADPHRTCPASVDVILVEHVAEITHDVHVVGRTRQGDEGLRRGHQVLPPVVRQPKPPEVASPGRELLGFFVLAVFIHGGEVQVFPGLDDRS